MSLLECFSGDGFVEAEDLLSGETLRRYEEANLAAPRSLLVAVPPHVGSDVGEPQASTVAATATDGGDTPYFDEGDAIEATAETEETQPDGDFSVLDEDEMLDLSSLPGVDAGKRPLEVTEDGPPPKRTSGMTSGFGMSSRLGFVGVPPSGGWTVAPTSSSSGAIFAPSWGFSFDDDARSPTSAVEFLRGVIPPTRVTEAERMDTARLVEQCDVDMVNLLAGYVLSKQRLGADRQRTLTEVEAMRSRLQLAEEEARAAKQELLESQSRVATLEGARSALEGEVERLGLDVTQLKSSADLDKETIASLGQELKSSMESRHSLVAGIPEIVKGVLGHRDVLDVLSLFNREAANYGRHLASIKIRASHPEIVLPDIDDGARDRLLEANKVWMAKDFAILARLAEMVDATLEDILGLLSS